MTFISVLITEKKELYKEKNTVPKVKHTGGLLMFAYTCAGYNAISTLLRDFRAKWAAWC